MPLPVLVVFDPVPKVTGSGLEFVPFVKVIPAEEMEPFCTMEPSVLVSVVSPPAVICPFTVRALGEPVDNVTLNAPPAPLLFARMSAVLVCWMKTLPVPPALAVRVGVLTAIGWTEAPISFAPPPALLVVRVKNEG